MPYKHEIIESNILSVVYTGEITLEDYRNATVDGLELGRKNNIERFLSDHVNVVSGISVVDIFSMPRFYDGLKADRKYKMALVVDNNDKRLKDYQFFETAAQNRGFNIKIFYDRDKALGWLKG